MRRVAALCSLVGLLAAPAWGASTINTTQPVQGVPYNAAPIRSNFGAAANDINALQNMNAGATAPSNPVLGTLWLNTPQGNTLYTLNIWDNRQSLWLPIAYLDSLNNLWMTNVGGGLPTSLLAQNTTDLGSVPQALVTITGAGPIYSFGASAPAGIIKFLTFPGATQLVYNATSLILPGGATITSNPGDMALATALGSGNWQILYFNSGNLIVPQGGTGRSSLTVHSVLLGEGASPVNFAVPATAGYPLLSTGATTDPAFGQLNLSTGVTNVLGTANGGTGASSLVAHGVVIAEGASAMIVAAPGAAGYPLLSTGTSGDPAFGGLLSGVPTAVSSLNSFYLPTFTPQNTAYAIELPLTGAVSDANPSVQDTLYVQTLDTDATLYANTHINDAGRFAAFGPNVGNIWQEGSKNIIGLTTYGVGATIGVPLTSGPIPGIYGVKAEAYQYGVGSGTNILIAHNPSAGAGGLGRAGFLAGVQGVVYPDFGIPDSTHLFYGVYAQNSGINVATSAYGSAGNYTSFIDPTGTTVTVQALVMPASASGFVGTKINYGLNNGNPSGGSWTDWLGGTNGGQYRMVDGGTAIATVDTLGVNMYTTGVSAIGYTANQVGLVAGNFAYSISGLWADGFVVPATATFSDAAIVLNGGGLGGGTIKSAGTITITPAGNLIVHIPGSDPHVFGALYGSAGAVSISGG